MEKINIAKLLKDCPRGMELDCTMYDNARFEQIDEKSVYPIVINIGNTNTISLTKEGHWNKFPNAKCVIFPKGKTTWEGFQRPFKDGDIIYNPCIKAVAIFCEQTDKATISHCYLNIWDKLIIHHRHCKFLSDWRLASEEEKAKLFQAIKDNGYRWDEESKTLETLPKFKDGDVVVDDSGAIFIYKQIHPLYNKPYADFYCGLTSEFRSFVIKAGELQRCGEISSLRYATNEEKQLLFDTIKKHGYNWNLDTKTLEKLPKFKVGDRIRHKDTGIYCTLGEYSKGISAYRTNIGLSITHKDLEQWELAPNKFDISKLKPFDKVLVRDFDSEVWEIDFFSRLLDGKHFKCHGASYVQCIPYKGNEHLSGKTYTCSYFYKTWEQD